MGIEWGDMPKWYITCSFEEMYITSFVWDGFSVGDWVCFRVGDGEEYRVVDVGGRMVRLSGITDWVDEREVYYVRG